jgi:hypothetical protein
MRLMSLSCMSVLLLCPIGDDRIGMCYINSLGACDVAPSGTDVAARGNMLT